MHDIRTMAAVQSQKSREIERTGNPALDAEGVRVMKEKRMAIDEPASEVKYDPLR